MEFRVLGSLEILSGGDAVPLTARKHRELVAALVLSRNRVVSRDALIDVLWGGRPPPSARKLLRVYVSQVRRLLARDRLETRPGGYLLRVDDGELDSARFDDLLRRGRSELRHGRAKAAHGLLSAALALWRGSALADVADEEFARTEAGRLDEARLGCIEGRIEADLALGRHAEVVPELEALVDRHPLRERPHRQLMLAFYRSGRQADALAVYRRVRAVLVDSLGLDPSPELEELHRSILQHDRSLDLGAAGGGLDRQPASALPAPLTATVGRDREILALREFLVGRDARLVTLVGPGGIGKTRLAVEAAIATAESFESGAVFVDLADASDWAQCQSAIAHALDLREDGATSTADLLATHLRECDLLLVLDNFEQLAPVAPLVAKTVAAAPGLTVLVTSRVSLHVSGEHVFPVAPLDSEDAVELFRARAAAAGAPMAEGELATAEEICELLDGLPLAIELAAPWLRSLPADELLRRLENRLGLLIAGPHDLPERQRTMRATLDWSYDLLSRGARDTLAQLSVFVGGFALEDAEAVYRGEQLIEHLKAILDLNFVGRDRSRYRLLEVVREYAADRLQDDGDVRSRHAAHFLEIAEAAESGLTGPDQAEWLRRLDGDHGNLLAALAWYSSRRETDSELRLAAALARFWYIRGHLAEGSLLLEDAIRRAGDQGDPSCLAKAFRAGSSLAVLQGDYGRARDLSERGLASYRQLDDDVGIARSLSNLGAILHAEGEPDLAIEVLDESVSRSETISDARLRALALNNRGDVALSQSDWATAQTCFSQSLALLRSLDDSANIARSLYNLGAVALGRRQFGEAARLLHESLLLSYELGDQEDIVWCLVGLGMVANRGGASRDAALLLQTALSLLARIGASMKPFEQHLFDRTRAAIREDGGPDLDDVPALTVEEAIRLATTSTQELQRERRDSNPRPPA
jgi:predicted ATPase/DNA-binding SARP family transcriptional activator